MIEAPCSSSMIQDDLKKWEENKPGRIIEDKCKQLFLVIFKESQESTFKTLYIIYNFMEQRTVKTFFNAGADDLLDGKSTTYSRLTISGEI